MSDFDDIFADASDDLLDTFGDEVIYTERDGTAHTFLADFNRAREIVGSEYQSSYTATTFTFKPSIFHK